MKTKFVSIWSCLMKNCENMMSWKLQGHAKVVQFLNIFLDNLNVSM
jgi:hypothetical protein